MSYLAAFSEAGLSLLNKVGNIVAPIEDLENVNDDTIFAKAVSNNNASISNETNTSRISRSFAEPDESSNGVNIPSEQPPPTVSTPFIANSELEKKASLRYRESIETELALRESKIRELELHKETCSLLVKDLQGQIRSFNAEVPVESPTMSIQSDRILQLEGQIERYIEDLASMENLITKKNKEIGNLKAQMSSLEKSDRIIENGNNENFREKLSQLECSAQQATEVRANLERNLTAVQAELCFESEAKNGVLSTLASTEQRLNEREAALVEYEQRLKEAEEQAWLARGEAAELMFARECDAKQIAVLESTIESMRQERRQKEEEQKEIEQMRAQQLNALSPSGASTQALDVDRVGAEFENIQMAVVVGESRSEDMKVLVKEKQVAAVSTYNDVTFDRIKAEFEEEKAVEMHRKQVEYEEKLRDVTRQCELKLSALQLEMNATVEEIRRVGGKESELAAENMRSLKAQINRAETENRQLHQVISQLRQTRRNNKDDADSIVAERDALRARVADLDRELDRLSFVASTSAEDSKLLQSVRAELSVAVDRNGQLEKALRDIKESSSQRIADLERSLYEKCGECDILVADIRLVHQDLEQRTLECRNVHAALAALQREMAASTARVNADWETRLEMEKRSFEKDLADLEKLCMVRVQEAEQRAKEAEEKRGEEAIWRRKAELDIAAEKKRMQKVLEQTLSQLKNSQEDVVDKVLVTNLIVKYFQRKRSVDVLALIARILSFTDEQKRIVGLTQGQQGGGGNLISSIFASIVGVPSDPTPEVGGENLAEMWVNFLLHESAGEPQGSHLAPSTTSTPRGSSSSSDSVVGESDTADSVGSSSSKPIDLNFAQNYRQAAPTVSPHTGGFKQYFGGYRSNNSSSATGVDINAGEDSKLSHPSSPLSSERGAVIPSNLRPFNLKIPLRITDPALISTIPCIPSPPSDILLIPPSPIFKAQNTTTR